MNSSNGTTGNWSLADGDPYEMMPWYRQAIYSFFFVTMALLSAGGNLIVIWIVVAHRRMRTVTNYFLVNLAVADTLISLLNTLPNFVYMMRESWPYVEQYCGFSLFIAPVAIGVSVLTFVAIAIDRYIAIVHPLKPRMSRRVILAAIAFIWTFSILICCPFVVFADVDYVPDTTRLVCYLAWPNNAAFKAIVYRSLIMCIEYFIPLAILAITYIRVGRELWGNQTLGDYTTPAQVESMRSKRKVVKMMVVVVIIFAVCWFPFHLYFIVATVYPSITHWKGIKYCYLAFYWLAMSNSMYNPMIYCWMNARFRSGFRRVFRWLPCVRKDPRPVTIPLGATRPGRAMSDTPDVASRVDVRRHSTKVAFTPLLKQDNGHRNILSAEQRYA